MNNKIRFIGFCFTLFILLGVSFAAWHSLGVGLEASENKKILSTTGFKENPPVTTIVKEVKIQAGDSLSGILENAGVSTDEQFSILSATEKVFDFSKIQAGKLIHIVFAQDAIASIDYDLSEEKKIVIEKKSERFMAKEVPIEYDVTEKVKSVTVESSLFFDGAKNGLTDKTLLELAKIFQWDVDFSTDIQSGDSFTVLYEDRRTMDGEIMSPGNILAAQFTNQGETYDAYYFELGKEESGYYSNEGKNRERQFLRSPISVGYISSGYTNRRVNPVTKRVAAHRAIDYAAPQGTPVVAIADGVVSTAGSRGGYGIMIEVEHGEYSSQFAHLSGVASGVEQGERVSQGQIIGYVGSTGISTGPHLQYALFKNGAPINPLTADLPTGKELDESLMSDFEMARDRQIKKLQLR